MVYENPAHMVNRLRAERSQIKAERDQLKAIIAEVVLALPALAGAAGEEIAAEILKALPPTVGESAAQGGYTLPAPAPQQQLPAPQQPQQHQLPAAGASAGNVVMPMLPEGFPLDALPPEYRAQAAQQRNGGQKPQQAHQTPQGRPGIQPPRFSQPRQQQAQQVPQQPIDVPYSQPNQPGVTVQRNVGITDVFHDGSNGKGGNVKIGRLAGGGAPQGAPGPRPNPGAAKISGLQAAVAKARAANGG